MRPLPSRTAETPSLPDLPLTRSLLPSLSLSDHPSPQSYHVLRLRPRTMFAAAAVSDHLASWRPLLPPYIEYTLTERNCNKALQVLWTVDAHSFPQKSTYVVAWGPKIGED